MSKFTVKMIAEILVEVEASDVIAAGDIALSRYANGEMAVMPDNAPMFEVIEITKKQ